MSNYKDSDSERAVIGCVLLNNEVIENAIEILTPSDFYENKHQRIFATMQKMYENNEPIECLSLSKRTLDCYHDTNVSEEELQQMQDSCLLYTSPSPRD